MQLFEGQVRFGIHSGQEQATYEGYRDLWQRAEELGFDWASVYDHFRPIGGGVEFDPAGGPCLEGLTLLAAMAAQTSRIRCGVLCVGVGYRNPAVLARMATTIDHISGGRLELGIGAGWFELEHTQYGIEYPSIGRRVRMLGEAAQILKSMWGSDRTTFEGRYFQIESAHSDPLPVQQPRIPIWIGGAGEKLTLRAVAEHADGWNLAWFPDPEGYAHKLEVLAAHCRDVGRDPSEIRKSMMMPIVLGETEAEVAEQAARHAARRNTTVEAIRERMIVGTPEYAIERILPYLRLGAADFICSAPNPPDYRTLELIATRVAPEVKREGAVQLAKG